MRTLPLGVRIVALVIPLALLPIAFVGGVAYYYLEDAIRADARNRERQTVDDAVHLVRGALDQAARVAQTTASLVGLQRSAARATGEPNDDALAQAIDLSLTLSPSVRLIALVGPTGPPAVLGSRNATPPSITGKSLPIPASGEPPGWTIDRSTGTTMVFATWPVASRRGTTVLVEIDPGWLRRSLAEMTSTEGGTFFLVDGAGQVLLTSPPGAAALPGGLAATLSAAPPTAARVLPLNTGERDILYYAAPAGTARARGSTQPTTLYLIRQTPRGSLIDQIAELRSTAALLAGAALALGLMGAGLIARTVVHRLNALLGMTARISNGQFDVRLPIGRDDEIGQLVGAFNAMAASLEAFRDRLVHAESFAAIGRVASTLAHEVRNPLNAMRGCVDYLRLKRPNDDIVTHHAGIIADEIAELDGFVRDFLRVARVERPRFALVDLHGLIDARLTLHAAAAAAAGVEVRKSLQAGASTVEADPQQMAMVLENLINNALEAMRGGGVLLITTEQSEMGVLVTVEDTGPGISAELAARISTPFFTTKPGGTGLGLAISRRVVEAHGGRFWFGNRTSGPGAAFFVDLPHTRQQTNGGVEFSPPPATSMMNSTHHA